MDAMCSAVQFLDGRMIAQLTKLVHRQLVRCRIDDSTVADGEVRLSIAPFLMGIKL